MKKRASVTIFLSLSLSSFIVFFMLLSAICISYSEKLRVEAATDMAGASVLGEYSKALWDRYGLLYIDSTYLSQKPDLENVEERLRYYLVENTEKAYKINNSPWGKVGIDGINIREYQTAAANMGASIRNQAQKYVEKSKSAAMHKERVEGLSLMALNFSDMEKADIYENWCAVMAQIDGMERPLKYDEQLERFIPVEVDNPASWVYSYSHGSILFTTNAPLGNLQDVHFSASSLISHRNDIDSDAINTDFNVSKEIYTAYLSDRMSCYEYPLSDSVIRNELEYIVEHQSSDYENFERVIQRIFNARMSDNYGLAVGSALLESARVYASGMEICTYDTDYIEPIAQSMVYAVAFLESISDVNNIVNKRKVPLHKSNHSMSLDRLISGGIYYDAQDEGLDYADYLTLMLLNEEDEDINLYSMDIMEMNLRKETNNPEFRMDRCVERIRIEAEFSGSGPGNMQINRTYGYY